MKLLIGFALLSVAFAIQPIQLPAPHLPEYAVFEGIELPKPVAPKVVELPTMFDTPDISPVYLSPELSAMLNEFGEIRPEFVSNQYDDVQILPIVFQTPDISPALISPELSAMLNEVGEIRQDVGVDAVQIVDGPIEAEYELQAADPVKVVNLPEMAENFDAVKFVDGPLETEYDAPIAQAVQVADLPVMSEVDAVQFVDASLEGENEPAVDAVQVADLPVMSEVDAVQFVDASLEGENEPAVAAVRVADLPKLSESVDAVQIVDSPVEAEPAVDSVLVADAPIEESAPIADAPASLNLKQVVAKLFARRS